MCRALPSRATRDRLARCGRLRQHSAPRLPNVKDRRVWEIVTSDLAPLKTAAEAILHDLDAEGGG
jgi:uncharacterized protein with HEPN domain